MYGGARYLELRLLLKNSSLSDERNRYGHDLYERAKRRVCQETIYRYIYSKEGMVDDLWWYLLPIDHVARRPRRTRKTPRTQIPS